MRHGHWIALVVIAVVFSIFLTGCPKKTPPPPPPRIETPPQPRVEEPVVPPAPKLDLRTIYFDFDKYNIKDDQRARLTDNAEQLLKKTDISVMLEGHCDERGTEAYNIALGEKRARAVRDFLVQYGVPATRLSTKTFGEERPVCKEKNEECYWRNRRVEFIVK